VTALLLDTCAAIWFVEGDMPPGEAMRRLAEAAINGVPTYVSPISAWEVGMLASRKRLLMSMSAEAWFERLHTLPGIHPAKLSARTLIASSFLPGDPPRDPIDRILAATARHEGFQLVTRDRKLLAYAEQGHLAALAC
jgi:PIN domain nuclease of toxin-antitoxin system